MSLIIITLGIMMIITLLSIISGNDFTSYSSTQSFDQTVFNNGTASEFAINDTAVLFQIDGIVGALIILVVIATIIGLLGIQFLGSGLSDTSLSTIRTGIIYGGIWGLLSVGASALIISIQTFGTLIYLFLTILYVVGVIQKMGENA